MSFHRPPPELPRDQSIQSPVLGLVGGVGCGKSTVARELAGRFGAVVIDGDGVGHAALAEPGVRDALAGLFGPDIFDEAGHVDRRALGRLVFGEGDEARSRRTALESVMHPVMRAEFERQIASGREVGAPFIVFDAAVLLESAWADLTDLIVFLDVPDPVREARVRSRGWDAEQWRRREASQWPLARKRAAAAAAVSALDAEVAAEEIATLLNQCSARPLPNSSERASAHHEI